MSEYFSRCLSQVWTNAYEREKKDAELHNLEQKGAFFLVLHVYLHTHTHTHTHMHSYTLHTRTLQTCLNTHTHAHTHTHTHTHTGEADRFVLPQPLVHSSTGIFNTRKLEEQPYIFLKSCNENALLSECIASFQWILVYVSAFSLVSLVAELETYANEMKGREEREAAREILAALARALWSSKDTRSVKESSKIGVELLGRLPFSGTHASLSRLRHDALRSDFSKPGKVCREKFAA